MKRKILVVANPNAGRGKISKTLNDLADFFVSNNVEHLIAETTWERRGDNTVKELLDATYTDLVIVGGDGTINECLNGMNYDIPVSFIPLGSGDDFVKMINIGKTKQDQFETILNGDVRQIDLGVCNGRKFANGVGIGFDGQIAADMLRRKVPLLTGQAKYYYHVLHILSFYQSREFDLTIDNHESRRKLFLLTISNGTTFGGGFVLAPHAKIDDGQLAICQIGEISAVRRFLNIHRLQSGTHDKIKEVDLFHAQHIEIGANDLLEAHIDGEYLGNPPFNISVLPGALKIRVS